MISPPVEEICVLIVVFSNGDTHWFWVGEWANNGSVGWKRKYPMLQSTFINVKILIRVHIMLNY